MSLIDLKNNRTDAGGGHDENYMYLGLPFGRCPSHIASTLYRRVIVNADGTIESADEHEKKYLNVNGLTPRGGAAGSGFKPRGTGVSEQFSALVHISKHLIGFCTDRLSCASRIIQVQQANGKRKTIQLFDGLPDHHYPTLMALWCLIHRPITP